MSTHDQVKAYTQYQLNIGSWAAEHEAELQGVVALALRLSWALRRLRGDMSHLPALSTVAIDQALGHLYAGERMTDAAIKHENAFGITDDHKISFRQGSTLLFQGVVETHRACRPYLNSPLAGSVCSPQVHRDIKGILILLDRLIKAAAELGHFMHGPIQLGKLLEIHQQITA